MESLRHLGPDAAVIAEGSTPIGIVALQFRQNDNGEGGALVVALNERPVGVDVPGSDLTLPRRALPQSHPRHCRDSLLWYHRCYWYWAAVLQGLR